MGLSDYLKTLQNQAGLGLVEWAAQSEVSRTSLWRWLSGKSLPRDAELESALAVLGADAAVRARAFGLLEAARGNGVLRLGEQTGLPLLDRSHLLVALRERAGLSQSEAALRAGIARNSLNRWENGVSWPSADRLHPLCFHYEVTQEELFALTLPSATAGGYLDAPLDFEETRAMFDLMTLGQIPPIPGMLLAQRLSFLAPTSAEARSLLCRNYAHLGNLSITAQSRVRTQHFLGLAQRLDEAKEAENRIQLALAQNHFIRAPLMYNAPPRVLSSLFHPEQLVMRKKQESTVGKQAYVLLGQVEGRISQASLAFKIRWYNDRAKALCMMQRREEALDLIERAFSLGEELEGSLAIPRLLDRIVRLRDLGEYRMVVESLASVPSQWLAEDAALNYDYGLSLYGAGLTKEARVFGQRALDLVEAPSRPAQIIRRFLEVLG